jgi:hypothetical protein
MGATLAARTGTITATAARVGCNPLAHLSCYLDACASAGGKAPRGPALEAFLPWAASETGLAIWQDAPRGPAP